MTYTPSDFPIPVIIGNLPSGNNLISVFDTNFAAVSNHLANVANAIQGTGGGGGQHFYTAEVTEQKFISAQGIQGTQGFQGTSGSAGINGRIGAQGIRGHQGTIGSGIQGPQGIPGNQGTTGPQGNVGPIGTQGAQGIVGVGYTGLTSVSDTNISTGVIDFAVNVPSTQTGFTVGTRIRIAATAAISNYMEGVIVSYDDNAASGPTIAVNVDLAIGSGEYNSWSISVAGVPGTQTSVYSFNALPAPTLGARAFVRDSTTTTFYDVVSGSGSNAVPVFGDGTVWRVG